MDSGSILTEGELSNLLGTLQDRFDWERRTDRFEIVDRWDRPRSGSIFYRLHGSPAATDLVVKVVPGWETGTPERAFDAMVELADLISTAQIEGAQGIRPLAWADNPPLLVMPYVESLDVVSILRQPEHEAWRSGDLTRWMERAGAMLAAYHQTTSGSLGDIKDAELEVRQLARKLRVNQGVVDEMLTLADWRSRSRRRYGDFGPGNLLGARDGTLYLIDPPEQSHVSVIHRDIANFVFEIRRQLAGRGFTPSAPVTRWFPDFRDRFLQGYVNASPDLAFGPSDQALFALFEVKRAAALAGKRFPRRVGDSAWFARLAIRRRLDLRRATRTKRPLSSR